MIVRIPDEYEAILRERCAKRGISLSEGLRQIMAMSWETWKTRGRSSTAGVTAHRRALATFQRRLGPGVAVYWQDNAGQRYEGIVVAQHPYNAKYWNVDCTEGPNGALGPVDVLASLLRQV